MRAAFEAEYGYPTILLRMKPAIEEVAMNWDVTYPAFPMESMCVLPASRSFRKARNVKCEAVMLMLDTEFASPSVVDQRCACSSSMEGGAVSKALIPSAGPAMPALAIKVFMKGVWLAMVVAAARSEDLDVTSQTIGIIDLFFWVSSNCECLI